MIRKIRVRHSMGRVTILVKVERNNNIAAQIALHPIVTDPPHTAAEITSVTGKIMQNYTLHLKGDHQATIDMHEHENTVDGMYWDMAEYIEVLANENDDPSLPISMGFEVYAERSPRKPKTFKIRDGNHAGELFVDCPVMENASAYGADIAEVIEGREPEFKHAGSCSITFMVLKNLKSDTKYLVRIYGIFSDGEGAPSNPLPFRTKAWQQ